MKLIMKFFDLLNNLYFVFGIIILGTIIAIILTILYPEEYNKNKINYKKEEQDNSMIYNQPMEKALGLPPGTSYYYFQ